MNRGGAAEDGGEPAQHALGAPYDLQAQLGIGLV